MDYLPNEVLIEVFSHLNVETLIVASKVCRRWLKIIQNSLKLTKNLSIVIAFKKNKPCVKIPIENANYQSIYFSNYSVNTAAHLKIFRILNDLSLNHLRTATFNNFPSPYLYKDILRSIIHLKILKVLSNNEEESSWFLNVKHLELDVDNKPNFIMFHECQLRHLKINLKDTRNINEEYSRNLTEFLNTQKDSLVELKISGYPVTAENLEGVLSKNKLKLLELEVNQVADNYSLLNSVSRSIRWNRIIFKNCLASDENKIIKICRSSEATTSVSIVAINSTFENFKNASLNFKLDYEFHSSAQVSLQEYPNITKIVMKRVDRESQIRLLGLLLLDKKVKILHLNLISHRLKIDRFVNEILSVVGQSIEELLLDGYSKEFHLAKQTLEVIARKSSRNFKKFTVVAGRESVDKMRENFNIFNETGIRAYALVKDIKDTNLNNVDPGNYVPLLKLCTWKRK